MTRAQHARANIGGLAFLALGSFLFLLLGVSLETRSHVAMLDFKVVYYSTRCLLQHGDPYNSVDLLRVYRADDKEPVETRDAFDEFLRNNLYPPTALPFVVPFALLSWQPAHIAWMTLIAAVFLLATCLMWDLAADRAPTITGFLLMLFLVGSELLIEVGNTAGIVVSLCAIATWCFLRERFVRAAILCLAIGLLVKPHDAGCVWLYFLLAGGLLRKRALQTLLVAAIFAVAAVTSVSAAAPHWLQETRASMASMSTHGDVNDPGPAAVEPITHGAILVTLQTAVSIFTQDPHIYQPITWLICAPLLLLWAYLAATLQGSHVNATLSLAAISALSMLPIYHRQHDTRLLLLIFPAFAVLWAQRGIIAWLALLFTTLATVFTSNVTLQLIAAYTINLRSNVTGPRGELLTVLLYRPAPLALLAIGIFYLFVMSQCRRAEVHTTAESSIG